MGSLEANDLVVSKLAAGRLKDLEFVGGLLQMRLASAKIVRQRIRLVPPDERERLRSRLRSVLEETSDGKLQKAAQSGQVSAEETTDRTISFKCLEVKCSALIRHGCANVFPLSQVQRGLDGKPNPWITGTRDTDKIIGTGYGKDRDGSSSFDDQQAVAQPQSVIFEVAIRIVELWRDGVPARWTFGSGSGRIASRDAVVILQTCNYSRE